MAEAVPGTPITGAFTPTSPLARKAAPNNDEIFSSQSFLKLLGAQMSSQNPLDPVKDTEFIGQMAQFSSLEQMTSLNQSMKAFSLSSQLTQSAALIGKSVSYVPTDGAAAVTGTVERLSIAAGTNALSLVVGGVPISLSQVREVR